MLCKALCAFREPFGDGAVEALYPGAPVDVPPELVARLVADGHIVAPAEEIPAAAAEPPKRRRSAP